MKMGIIWSWFKKKESTKEKLKKIQEKITNLEEYGVHTEQTRKKLVGSLLAYSIFFCFIAAVICYFYYLPPTLEERLLYASYFIGFIIIIYAIKKLLTWYYRWKVRGFEKKLSSLKEEKEAILDLVMDNETYKVAKEILEMYAPEQIRKASMVVKSPILTPSAIGQRMPIHQSGELRRRIVPPQASQSFGPRATPIPVRPSGPSPQFNFNKPYVTPRPPQQMIRHNITASSHSSLLQGPRIAHSPVSPMNPHPYSRTESGAMHPPALSSGDPPGPPMPRPVLPRERGILDRFVEFLVGDGPSNRYALVCRQCESHNGMALKEEFPYMAFRCAYCFYWNPARKQKPAPPRLEVLQQRTPDVPRRFPQKSDNEASSSEDEDLEEDTESDSSSSSHPSSSEDRGGREANTITNRTTFPHGIGAGKIEELLDVSPPMAENGHSESNLEPVEDGHSAKNVEPTCPSDSPKSASTAKEESLPPVERKEDLSAPEKNGVAQ